MDAFNLVARLSLDTSEYDSALGRVRRDLPEVGEEADKQSEKISKVGTKLGSAFKVAGAAIGTALAAAAAGATALVKKSVDAYANYEQLVGGVETLFSSLDGTISAAPTVLENAANAYKTAGMSANQYMETVTSFSAALVSGLEGDYQKAAEVSDMALRDMSDNVNKMGSTLESIQNAYQGFSKQNYTMLDNLKLGYGGTKTEMERLLADAEKFSGVKYDISNLADVYEAIHVIQQEMGIAGTTAEEAAATISGSFGSLQAAWENLITGFSDKEADLSKLINNVVIAAEGTFNNLLPTIEQAIIGVSDFVEQIAPVVAQKLPEVAQQIIPTLLDTAESVVEPLITAIPSLIGTIIEVIPSVVSDIITTVGKELPKIGATVQSAANSIITGIGETLPELIPQVVGAIGDLAREITKPESLKEMLNAGLTLVTGLAKGIGEALPQLAEAVGDIIGNIVEFLVDPDNTLKIVDAAFEIIMSLAGGLIQAVPKLIGKIAEIPGKIIDTFINNDWESTGNTIIDKIAEGFTNGGSLLTDAVGGVLGVVDSLLGTNLKKWYDDVVAFWKDAGSKLYQVLHADEIEEREENSRAVSLRTQVVGYTTDYIKQGLSAEDAYNQAISEYIKSAEDSYIFDKYYGDQILEDFKTRFEEIRGWVVEETRNELSAASERAALRSQKLSDSIVNSTERAAEIAKLQAEIAQTSVEEVTAALDDLSFETRNIGDYRNLGVAEVLGKSLSDEEKRAKQIADTVFSASQEYANRQTAQLDLTLSDQIALWEKIKNQFVEGSDQFLKSQDKIVALQKKQSSEEAKAAENAAKAIEQSYQDRQKAIEDYQKKLTEIYTDIDAIENSYVSTLTARSEEIYNSFGLFDKVPERILYSGIDLTNNLENQIDTLEKFYRDIEDLAGRGVSEALVSEIRSMGVGALDQLDALLDLSTDELSQYDELVARKRELSQEVAEGELSDLRKETNDKIAEKMTEIDALTQENAENLGLSFAEGIANGIKNGASYIADATQLVLNNVNAVNTAESTVSVTSAARNNVTGQGTQITVNVYGIQYQDIGELTQAISEELTFQLERTARGNAGA